MSDELRAWLRKHEETCASCDTCRGVWCAEAAGRCSPPGVTSVRSIGPDGKQVDRPWVDSRRMHREA